MNTLVTFRSEIEQEVLRILSWWRSQAVDLQNGGFYGEVDQYNVPQPEADKGGILHGRLLWTFAAAYHYLGDEQDKVLAERAYHYILNHFIDHKHGGSYWSLYADGRVKNDRKQIYSIAFILYGLAEYYKIKGDAEIIELAIQQYRTIEQYSRDPEHGGYFEAFARDWTPLQDQRLSVKDRNDPKTMNSHLHIIEAYANLYSVWPDAGLAQAIKSILSLFETHIIHKRYRHLNLFFTQDWQPTSEEISFGHTIEASWLLQAGAKVLQDPAWMATWTGKAVELAQATLQGFQNDGSLYHEYDLATHQVDRHREWWVSAEAMVGYLNAYTLDRSQTIFLDKTLGLWAFIKQHLLDYEQGDWYWGVMDDYSKMKMYKMGFWKCPYHTVRACLEILSRLEKIIN